MKYREKLGYIALGGMIWVFGLAVGLCVSPLTAQRSTFDEIVCISLRIAYPDGTTATERD